MLIGTLFNATTILFGSLIGLVIGRYFNKKLQETLFIICGLTVMIIGLQMALQATDIIGVMTCLFIGSVIGEALDIEYKLAQFGDHIKHKLGGGNSQFTEGFVTATLTFCVGSLAIVGAIEEGLNHNYQILMAKGIIDGICAILFATTLGYGVLFSAICVLLYQGSISLGALYAAELLTEPAIAMLSSVGGILIIALALKLLELKPTRVANLLPALLLALLWPQIKSLFLI